MPTLNEVTPERLARATNDLAFLQEQLAEAEFVRDEAFGTPDGPVPAVRHVARITELTNAIEALEAWILEHS